MIFCVGLVVLVFTIVFFFKGSGDHRLLHSFPTRRSSDLIADQDALANLGHEVTDAAGRVGQQDRVCPRGLTERAEDRKSTRLNSSHVRTSYAVFCLKKKIKLGDDKEHEAIKRVEDMILFI